MEKRERIHQDIDIQLQLLSRRYRQHEVPNEVSELTDTWTSHVMNRVINDTSEATFQGGAQGTSGMPLKWNVGTTPLLATVNKREHFQALATWGLDLYLLQGKQFCTTR